MPAVRIEDRALRDPRMTHLAKRIGLARFDAFGRWFAVIHYAQDVASHVLSRRDVDDLAEHDGFAAALVDSDLATRGESDERIILLGLAERRLWHLPRHATLVGS